MATYRRYNNTLLLHSGAPCKSDPVGSTIEDLRQRLQRERELIARLRTANMRFTDAQTERIWAIVAAHQAGRPNRSNRGLGPAKAALRVPRCRLKYVLEQIL